MLGLWHMSARASAARPTDAHCFPRSQDASNSTEWSPSPASYTESSPSNSTDSSQWSPSPAPSTEGASSNSTGSEGETAPASNSTSSSAVESDAASLPEVGSSTYSGDGTAFSDAVANTGAGFACSFRYLNNWASKYFVAMNNAQWDNGARCGTCIRAQCVDPKCPVQNKPVVAMVVDKCPECKHGDIDFSYPAYTDVTGSWPNRLKIEWEFVDCGALIDGTISIYPKDGSNAYWQAVYFANSRYPIVNVTLGGSPMYTQDGGFGFWTHSGAAPDNSELVLTDSNGAVVKTTLKSISGQQDLGVQFPLATDSSSVTTAGRR